MLLQYAKYQDVLLSDFSPDTRLGRDLQAYAKKYSRKVRRNTVLELIFIKHFNQHYFQNLCTMFCPPVL